MGRQQASAQYRGYRNAGIRLNEDLLPHLYDRPEAVDEIIWAIHDFDKAHLVMLVEEKLIPRESGVAMLRALREMEERGVEVTRKETGGGIHVETRPSSTTPERATGGCTNPPAAHGGYSQSPC